MRRCVAAMHQSHLAVEESIFEGLPPPMRRSCRKIGRAAWPSSISAPSRRSFAVYDGDALLLATARFRSAATICTRDVSWLLKVNYEDAENLKREYGCAVTGTDSGSQPDRIAVRRRARACAKLRCRQLNEILEARAEEIFERIYAEILRVGMEQSLLEGAVLTGGGAQLAGMCDVAERMLNCQARNGLAIGIEDWPRSWISRLDGQPPAWPCIRDGLKLKRDWKRRRGLASVGFTVK